MNERLRRRGIALAFGAAAVSGAAVFVNGYGVRAVPDATVYTTAKNLVAAVALAIVALVGIAASRGRPSIRQATAGHPGAREMGAPATGRRRGRVWLGLLAIALIGGSVPFVLFFEGLARASSTQAAFIHKTLILWVAVLAVPLLKERLGWPHVAAIAVLMGGQILLAGGLSKLRLGGGEILILLATLLWAVEVIVAKRLLGSVPPRVLAVSRMGLGVALLLGWTVLTGRMSTLVGLSAEGWLWAAATGLILAGYVAVWYGALALAPALDVTAVLVVAAVVTGLLNLVVKGSVPTTTTATGLVLVTAGALLVAARRGRASLAAPS